VASRGRHTRSTPKLPLATLEVDLEKLIIKGKTLKEGTSTTELGISNSSHFPLLETPIPASQFPSRPFTEVSRFLNFGSVPLKFPSPGLAL